MEGNAKIIKLIARDEALHLAGTMQILNLWKEGSDDLEMVSIAKECEGESMQMLLDAAQEEKDWAGYLFKDGSMVGLNYEIVSQYVEYITNLRARGLGFEKIFPKRNNNPIPWMSNWLSNDNVQPAPQEAEISSYLTGQVDASIEEDDFDDFNLEDL